MKYAKKIKILCGQKRLTTIVKNISFDHHKLTLEVLELNHKYTSESNKVLPQELISPYYSKK